MLIQIGGLRSLWQDVRGQLLLAVLLLAASYFVVKANAVGPAYWLLFSYQVMGLCGLLLVLQVAPGRER